MPCRDKPSRDLINSAIYKHAAHHPDGTLVTCNKYRSNGKISYRRVGSALKAAEKLYLFLKDDTNDFSKFVKDGSVQRPYRCSCGFVHLTREDLEDSRLSSCATATARTILKVVSFKDMSDRSLYEVHRSVITRLHYSSKKKNKVLTQFERHGLILRGFSTRTHTEVPTEPDLIFIKDRVALEAVAVDGYLSWS